jgi:hypothetical protein
LDQYGSVKKFPIQVNQMSFSSKPLISEINECVVFAGPGGEAWDSKAIDEQVDALTKQGCHVTQIGDGDREINVTDLSISLPEAIGTGNKEKLLVINAHGRMSDDEHLIKLGEHKWISTLSLLKLLQPALGNTPIQVVSEACHAGLNCREASEILPPGSHFLALSKLEKILELEKTTLRDSIRGLPFKLNNFSADNLLKVYLSKVYGTSLYSQDSIPMICSNDNDSPLEASLVYIQGRKFTLRENLLIQDELSEFIHPDVLNDAKKLIEKSIKIPEKTRLMGAALAIAHVMRKHNPSLFIDFFNRPVMEERPFIKEQWQAPSDLEAGAGSTLVKKLLHVPEHDLAYFIEKSKEKSIRKGLVFKNLNRNESKIVDSLLSSSTPHLPNLGNLSSTLSLKNKLNPEPCALEKLSSMNPLSDKHDFFNSKLLNENLPALGSFAPTAEITFNSPTIFKPSFTLSKIDNFNPPIRSDWFESSAFKQQIPTLSFGDKKPIPQLVEFAKGKIFGKSTDPSFFGTSSFREKLGTLSLGGFKPDALTNKFK